MSAVVYPFPVPMRRRRGFGALDLSSATIANQAASAATITGQLAGALSGIPVVGPAVAAAAQIGLLLANVFSGCGKTCVEASNLANQAEPILLQNLQNYLNAPIRYASLQAAALNNFDLTWNALTQACSDPSLGSAGQACISDRQRGACHYQTSPGGWSQASGNWTYQGAGPQGSGTSCWNWFVGYRDPIANDPGVVPDPVPGAAAVESLATSVGLPQTLFGLPSGDVLMLAGALLLAAVFI